MDKHTAMSEIFNAILPRAQEVFDRFNKRTKNSLTIEAFIEIISRNKYNLVNDLGISNNHCASLIKELLPDKPPTNQKVCTYLLKLVDLKYCARCNIVQDTSDFRKNAARSDGLNAYCKKCHLETTASTQPSRQSAYKARNLNQIPAWADLEKISEFYSKCPEGYHVDHIIPLKGELVSGLHVLENLQYLPATENCSKGNRFNIDAV